MCLCVKKHYQYTKIISSVDEGNLYFNQKCLFSTTLHRPRHFKSFNLDIFYWVEDNILKKYKTYVFYATIICIYKEYNYSIVLHSLYIQRGKILNNNTKCNTIVI